MSQENPTVHDVISAYAEHSEHPSPENEWSSFYLIDLGLDGEWDKIWEILVAFTSQEFAPKDALIAVLAAGPLEELLANAGPEFIDRIETQARTNSIFARALSGVWQSSIEPSVWARVTTICRKIPNPIDGKYAF